MGFTGLLDRGVRDMIPENCLKLERIFVGEFKVINYKSSTLTLGSTVHKIGDIYQSIIHIIHPFYDDRKVVIYHYFAEAWQADRWLKQVYALTPAELYALGAERQ